MKYKAEVTIKMQTKARARLPNITAKSGGRLLDEDQVGLCYFCFSHIPQKPIQNEENIKIQYLKSDDEVKLEDVEDHHQDIADYDVNES